MALARCKECNGAVSRRADHCPHCGAVLHRKRWGSVALAAMSFGAGFLAANYAHDQAPGTQPLALSAGAASKEASDPDRDPAFISSFSNQRGERLSNREREVRTLAYFRRNRAQILQEIRGLARVGRYEVALQKVQPYLESRDGELLRLRDEVRERQIVAQLRRIPASEYSQNRDLYEELTRLNPDEPAYRAKLEHYESMLDKEQAREQEIVTLLKTIPVEEYKRNRDLYAELVRLNPEDAIYRSKLTFYQAKLDEQAGGKR